MNLTLSVKKDLSIAVVLLSIIGCASIDPKPFENFNASLVELDKGVTSTLDVTIPMSESRYRKELIDEVMQGDEYLLSQLALDQNDNDPFYVSDPPIFLIAQSFRQSISQTNMVWLDYSKLLVQLSSRELVDENEFEQMATDLNANALDAIQALVSDPSNASASNAALFSEAAILSAKEYIKAKTKKNLIDSITENQLNIDGYVALMQVAIVTMAQTTSQEHSDKQQDLQREFIRLVHNNDDGKQDAKIQKYLTDLIETKRTHSAQMASLQALHAAYGRIPEAHNALAARLKNSGASIAAISALLEKGIQLYVSYDAKAKLNKAELVQAKADAASSQATAMEFKYQQAELKASQAEFDYALSQSALNAVPNNEENGKDVKNKKMLADGLRLEADKLKESAIALRAAATAIQESANEVKSSITDN